MPTMTTATIAGHFAFPRIELKVFSSLALRKFSFFWTDLQDESCSFCPFLDSAFVCLVHPESADFTASASPSAENRSCDAEELGRGPGCSLCSLLSFAQVRQTPIRRLRVKGVCA
jgi:hypothetical protein